MAALDLMDVIHQYDVCVDSSALQSVLNDEEQGRLLSEWAKAHLTSDTLLSKDEVNSYVTKSCPLVSFQQY